MDIANRFLDDQAGQDLVEYSLLIMFIVIAAMAIMQQTGNAVVPVWSAGNSVVQTAARLAS